MINIYLDDLRPCPAGFVIARDAGSCLFLLKEFGGRVNILSLDHDLGNVDAFTGYDVVKQLVNDHMAGYIPYFPKVIYLHTANGIGRDNMYFYLKNYIEHAQLQTALHRGPAPYPYKED